LFSSFVFVFRLFAGISLQQLGAGVGLAERGRVAPQLHQCLLQGLMARLIDDFENQGLAALPDALQVSELRRAEGFLLLFDIFLLIILKILLIDVLLLFDNLLIGVHIARLLCIARRHLAINVFQIAEAT
jgi:hypothetical protein